MQHWEGVASFDEASTLAKAHDGTARRVGNTSGLSGGSKPAEAAEVIQRAGYDLLRIALRVAIQLWPLWLFWWVLGLRLRLLPRHRAARRGPDRRPHGRPADLEPILALVSLAGRRPMWPGPADVCRHLRLSHPAARPPDGHRRHRRHGDRHGHHGLAGGAAPRPGSTTRATASTTSCASPTPPSCWPGVFGIAMVALGAASLSRPFPVGRRGKPLLQRARSDNFGHAAWLSMRDAQDTVSGPHPVYGGIVVGEPTGSMRTASPVPRSTRTSGLPGAAAAPPPLLIDPCRSGSTHALVLAGSGGYKTTSVRRAPPCLAWTGSAVVLDSLAAGDWPPWWRNTAARSWRTTSLPWTRPQPGPPASTCWTGSTPPLPLAESHVAAVVGLDHE